MISKDSEEFLCYKKWGFSKPKMNKDSYKALLLYRDVLQRYNIGLIRDNKSDCLCVDEVQRIIENTLNLVNINCINDFSRCDIVTDGSNKDSWVLLNPGCVAFEDWEEKMHWIIPKVGFKVTNVSDSYKVFYDLSVDRVTDIYQVLYTLTVVSKAINEGCYDININVDKLNCDLGYEAVIKDVGKCKLEYNALIKQIECNTELNSSVKSILCNLEFETYTKLLECNLSTSIISKLMACGIQVTYNSEKKCAELKVGSSSILLDEGFDTDIFGEDVDLSILETLSRNPCKMDIPIDLVQNGYIIS